MEAGNKDKAELGPWADADLRETARTIAASGADADLPDEVRFIASVTKLIRRRLVEKDAAADQKRLAIFLLEPLARSHKADAMPKRIPMLNNGLTSVNGRLWFVNPVVVSGSYIDIEEYDDDALFHIITDELHLGNVSAIVFDPRTITPQIRFYKNGLNSPDVCDEIVIQRKHVSLMVVFDVIDHVYRTCLITPDAQPKAGKLWIDHNKHWPSENAEDIIQLYLKIGLAAAFPMCTVRHEQTSVPGRLDLEIEECNPQDRSQITRHAVLELKVLRSFRSTGSSVSENTTLTWVQDGVKQAAAYRDERGALSSALCCFDMRSANTGDQCFAHVAELSKTINVALKRCFLYATAKLYRDATTTPS